MRRGTEREREQGLITALSPYHMYRINANLFLKSHSDILQGVKQIAENKNIILGDFYILSPFILLLYI